MSRAGSGCLFSEAEWSGSELLWWWELSKTLEGGFESDKSEELKTEACFNKEKVWTQIRIAAIRIHFIQGSFRRDVQLERKWTNRTETLQEGLVFPARILRLYFPSPSSRRHGFDLEQVLP